jgi:hypothetical protein
MFAKLGILPPDFRLDRVTKRSRQSRATFVASSTCVLDALVHSAPKRLFKPL